MNREMGAQRMTSYNSFIDVVSNKMIRIAAPEGQAQYLLDTLPRCMRKQHGEWMLLCRFANTIQEADEVRELQRLASHIEQQGFELTHAYVYPPLARAVEREIVLRSTPESAAGLGTDITYAMRMLNDLEGKTPKFSQAERNLLLNHAFHIGAPYRTEQMAHEMLAKAFSRRKVIDACMEIEDTALGWMELDSMDGLKFSATQAPGGGLNLWGCDSPGKHYPPFALYRGELPSGTTVLMNGTILFPSRSQDGWWRSGLRRVDETFTVPRHYKSSDGVEFEAAEQEYRMEYGLGQGRQAASHDRFGDLEINQKYAPEQGIMMGGM